MSELRDTIPRLHQILPHMRDQLIALQAGATFEDVRLRYSATVDRLVLTGTGRRTASRVGDQHAFWRPAAEALLEAMRLGFVERTQVPSALKYVETYRNRRYELTDLGRNIAELAQVDAAGFCDRLSVALYGAHPYFRALVAKLVDAPIACPEISEGDVDEARRDGRGTEYWASFVAEQLERQKPGAGRLTIDVEQIKKDITSFMRRRFDTSVVPTGKALTQAMNEAFAVASFTAHGLVVGATEIDILKSWGSQLRILDQSRYVPHFEGLNIIWIAADVEKNGGGLIRRRTLADHELQIAEAVINCYHEQASDSDTSLTVPYLPIYRVRADAAFRCGVTRALVDMVIQRLSDNAIPQLDVRVRLHLGTTNQPISEPLYRRGGNRRYELTVHHAERKGA